MMQERLSVDRQMVRTWVRVGLVAGIVAVVTYPLAIFVEMPRGLTLIVAGSFGPALGLASIGLYRLLRLHRNSVTAQIGALSNVVAGALVTAMIIVQLTVAYNRDDYFAILTEDQSVRTIVDWVWNVILGLDVAFDIYIGLGTILFGLAMLRHPRFGRIVGWAGVLAGGANLVLNFIAFPDT
ncbi:MAG: hypothetical protein WCE80_00650, partial [Acidimicrobiia bacterium]